MKEEVDEYLTLSRVGAARNVLGPHVLLLLRKFTLDTVRVMRMNDKDMSGKLTPIKDDNDEEAMPSQSSPLRDCNTMKL